MKGIIALDIDGTITIDQHAIPQEVAHFLSHLASEGWAIIFITGRSFRLGYRVLKSLSFPYYVAAQNGSIIIEMPSQKILKKKYLDRSILPAMEQICQDEPTDFAIYAGFEKNDLCYYRPEKFSPELQEFLRTRMSAFEEHWQSVPSFESIDIQEFPSVKCFGELESALRISTRIEKEIGLHVPIIRDPHDEKYFVIQATHEHVSKGEALKDFIDLHPTRTIVIAAGDDNNDRTMLAEADIKIVMSTAPVDMLATADIIAQPAAQKGIIEGLLKAIAMQRKNSC